MVDLANQIAALDSQVASLQQNHDSVFRTVAQFEADNKHKNLTRPLLPKPLQQNSGDDPPLIHFSYFDDLINHYFHKQSSSQDLAPPTHEKVLGAISTRLQGANSALQELVWRLGGVSAFPINNTLYDDSADALLGIRFDVVSRLANKYVLPHYIILRRREDKLAVHKWLVFRYTTPPYVPLGSYSHYLDDDNLFEFADSVRACLVRTQYKHDKFDKLAQKKLADIFGPQNDPHDSLLLFSAVEKDLECRRVALHINAKMGRLKHSSIELECGLTSIEKVHCVLEGASKEELMFSELQLTGCNFNNLESSFVSLAKYLRSHNLL